MDDSVERLFHVSVFCSEDDASSISSQESIAQHCQQLLGNFLWIRN